MLFGGGNGLPSEEVPNSETWAYDTDANTWTHRDPYPRPTARGYVGMAYAPAFDRTLLFGGCGPAACPTNDTWAYDVDENAWTNLTPATGPSPREMHTVAYDTRANRLILFGGMLASSNPTNDTWAYDHVNNTWTKMSPARSPAPRYDHAMSYDAESDRVVLFGGWTAGSGIVDDTWAYDYGNNTWTEMDPGTRPPARQSHVMVYDAQSDLVILFGGLLVGQGDDTWTYRLNNNTWSNRNPAANPGERRHAAIAYVGSADRILLFGGGGTWAYDAESNVWADLAPGASPPDRVTAGMAYDSQSDRTVLFGGWNGNFLEDVWWYDYGPAIPTEPRNVTAAAGDARVDLSWEAPASAGDTWITGYRVYRGVTPGGETLVATLGNVLAYGDGGLTNGVTYYYRVSALNAFREGPLSAEVSATPVTVPSEPRNLQATAGDAVVMLTWQPPLDDGGAAVTSYRVYRGFVPGNVQFLQGLGAVLTHDDTAVQNGVTYYYEIRAVNVAGEGPPSAKVSATPRAPDTSRPTVEITSPPDGAVLDSRNVTVSGTASDNVAVARVEVSVDGATWVQATGTTAWSAPLALTEGTNTIYARATDTSGNANTTSITVIIRLPGPAPAPWGYLLVALVLAVVTAATVAALLVRRRRRAMGDCPPK